MNLERLRIEIENVLRNFHRNACYPEPDETETRLAYEAIICAFRKEEMFGEIGDEIDTILDRHQLPRVRPTGWTDAEYERLADWLQPMRNDLVRLREIAHDAASPEFVSQVGQ